MYDIKFIPAKTLKAKPADESKLGFGQLFTDYMFIMDYNPENGWHNARVQPYQNFSMDPAVCRSALWPDDIRGSEGIPPRRRRHPDLPSARQLPPHEQVC